MLELNTIYNMDCIQGMRMIDDNSLDLIVTSPPYDETRDYKGDWNLDLHSVGLEINRVLKPGGVCAMVIQDQTKGVKSLTSFQTIVDWVHATELNLWECIIYNRKGTEGAWWSKRFRVDHEYIPIFVKGKKPQFFNKQHLAVPSEHAGKVWTGTQRLTDGTTIRKTGTVKPTKCRGTVWQYATSNSEGNRVKLKHPATFPDKLAEDLILAFTNEQMTVGDPFMGSGTTARMAKKHNRKYIGFEIAEQYCDIADVLM